MIGKLFRQCRFSAAVAGLILIFSAIYSIDKEYYYEILRDWGLAPFAFPFVDTHAVLSAIECHRLGMDVFLVNRCDVLDRAFVYSPAWLWLSGLPVTTDWTSTVGICLGCLFALSLSLLPQTTTARQTLLFGACLASPMTAYAIERGNNDLVIFVLFVLAVVLLQRSPVARALGYLLIVLAGLLKFYPLTALSASLVREKPRGVLVLSLAAAITLSVFGVCYSGELLQVMKNVPHGEYYTDLFAAKNLPLGFAQLVVDPLDEKFAFLAPLMQWLPHAVFVVLLSQWGVDTYRLAMNGRLKEAYGDISAPSSAFLFCGSVLIVGCFFAGQSIYYRGILFLFVLPGLLALADGARSALLPRQIATAGALILLLMWSECFREGLLRFFGHVGIAQPTANNLSALFWLVRELIWWRVIATLSGLIACALAQYRRSLAHSRLLGGG